MQTTDTATGEASRSGMTLAECSERAIAVVCGRAERETNGIPDTRADLRTTFGGLDDGIAASMFFIQEHQISRGRWPMGQKLWLIAQARERRADKASYSVKDPVAETTGKPDREYDYDLARFRSEREAAELMGRAEQARALLGAPLADAIVESATLAEAAALIGLARMTVYRKLQAVRLAILAAEQIERAERKQLSSEAIASPALRPNVPRGIERKSACPMAPTKPSPISSPPHLVGVTHRHNMAIRELARGMTAGYVDRPTVRCEHAIDTTDTSFARVQARIALRARALRTIGYRSFYLGMSAARTGW